MPKISISKTRNNRGFTLAEIIIVLVILSGLAALALPRLDFNKKNNLKTIIREISVLGREIRNHARLTKATHRLVLRTGPENSSYWVERSDAKATIQVRNEDDDDDDNKKSDGYSRAEKLLKKDKKFPSGFYISKVETQSQPETPSNNVAYIYFFPEGFVEQAVIQVTGNKEQTWTLVFNPLTGHSDVIEEALSLKDLEKQ